MAFEISTEIDHRAQWCRFSLSLSCDRSHVVAVFFSVSPFFQSSSSSFLSVGLFRIFYLLYTVLCVTVQIAFITVKTQRGWSPPRRGE